MYLRAKSSCKTSGHELQFYDFYEWIHNDISKTVYDRNLQMKTGLEKKAFQPKLNQISFGNKLTSVSKQPEGPKRNQFGLPLSKPINVPLNLPVGGADDKVKSMLGTGLKLDDIKSRQKIAGIEALKKKVQDGTAPSHQKLYERRKTLNGKPESSESLECKLNDLNTQLRKAQ